eukprot:Awhi_evm1s7216
MGPIFAFFISCSRIVDYRHHPSDVNGGIIIAFVSVLLVQGRGIVRYTYYYGKYYQSGKRKGARISEKASKINNSEGTMNAIQEPNSSTVQNLDIRSV